MVEREHISIGTRLLACVCVICPVCLFGRHWPNSRLMKWCNKMRYRCPFCKAYAKVKRISIVELLEPDKAVPIRRD